MDFDSASNTVILGTVEKQPTALTSLKNSGGTRRSWVLSDKGDLTVAGSDANQTFTSGIFFNIWNGPLSYSKGDAILFESSGYTQVTFSVWSDIDCMGMLVDQDGTSIGGFNVTANTLTRRTLTIPAGVTKIGFAGNAIKHGVYGSIKIMDPVVQ